MAKHERRAAPSKKKPRQAGSIVSATSRVVGPFLGPVGQAALGAIETAFSFTANDAVRERIDDFTERLREEYSGILARRGYDRQTLDAQSLVQLSLLAAQAVVVERLAEKRRLYARILCRAHTREWRERADRVEEALRALIDVTEADFRVLNAVMEATRETGRVIDSPPTQDFDVDAVRRRLSDLTPVGVKTYLARLTRVGLVLEIPTAGTDVEHGSYIATHLLHEVARLIVPPADSQ